MNTLIFPLTRRYAALLIVLTVMLVCGVATNAQSDEKAFEIGGQFSVLRLGNPVGPLASGNQSMFPDYEFDGVNRYGLGGRLTYNLNKYLAVEGEGNVFIEADLGFPITGKTTYQGQFGIKAGKRFSNFGVFAKVRPGFIRFKELVTTVTVTNNGVSTLTSIDPA